MDNTVFIVDDDASVRDSLGLLLSLNGFRTLVFADGPSLLGALRPDWRGCLIVDIRMPGMDGLALQRELNGRGCAIPVVIATGHGDVASARTAFRADAVDFLEKPFDEERLIQAVHEAFARQDSRLAGQARHEDYRRRLATLTPREREVLDRVVADRHNREIAAELGISVRTVEVHKSRMMDKLGAATLPQLIRMSLGADDGAPAEAAARPDIP